MVSIGSINQYGKISNNVSFTGHNLSQNDKGEKTYRFFIPKVSYDEAKVILRKFKLDRNGEILPESYSPVKEINIPKSSSFVEINPRDMKLTSSEVLGYRFVIDGQSYNDKHRGIKADNTYYNIADVLSSDVLKTPKSIYHLIPGVFNPDLKQTKHTNALGDEIENDDKTVKMTHFMKFDARLNDVTEKLSYIKDLGFRRILSTPIFGQDNISGIGYWTTNPFQITERLGNLSDFKKLQVELFKKSMGLIADGAFTSEGLMGIHFRDVLRRGEKSPFAKWFELSGKPALGVLPDKDEVYDNFEIRVINSPFLWAIDEKGLPKENFGAKNVNYNPKKETLIQIYDKRLTSEEQLSKDEAFDTYAIKNLPDRDAITSWTDSVLPYTFPVSVEELAQKVSNINKNKTAKAKEFMTQWENFSLVRATDSANIRLWTGNKDMLKLRFTVPGYQKNKIMESAYNESEGLKELDATVNATKDVQDYVVSIGEYWTNKTAKTLREYIAKQIANGQDAEDFRRIILAKAGNELPKELSYITTTQISNAINNDYYSTAILRQPVSLTNAIKEYPMEALEVSDDLLSIFAYPSFKKEADEKLYAELIPNVAKNIIEKLDSRGLPCGELIKDGQIIDGKEKIVQLISDDISRFIFLKGLKPDLTVDEIFSNDPEDLAKLKNINAINLCGPTDNLKDAQHQLLSTMANNIENISPYDIQKLVDILKTKLGNITPNAVKVADLIIDKSEAGLNWRVDAAKDISDIEAYEEGRADINETWGEVEKFWTKFNKGVKAYNAHSYKIAELTNTSVHSTESTSRYKNTGVLESKVIEHGGFTSQSNYNYLFDTLQRFFTAQPEYNAPMNSNALDLICNKFARGWNGVPGYLFSGSKNNIVFSHSAVGNHDKQRVSHTFSFNMLLAYLNEERFINLHKSDDFWKNIASEIRADLLNSSIDKSLYYDDINDANYRHLFYKISPRNLAKLAALNDAFSDAVKNKTYADELRLAFTRAVDKLAARNNPNSKQFFYKNFETTIDDICELLPPIYKNEVNKLRGAIHRKFTQPARARGIELAKLMVAVPGNPTIFAGDELLELGGEEKAKNVTLQNRNRIHWEHLTDRTYAHVTEYEKKLAEIYKLRNDENLSCLVNGDTLFLQKQGELSDREILGMYRYNEHDDCIILMHNAGMNSSRNFKATEEISIDSINLSAGSLNYYPDGWKTKDGVISAGLPERHSLKEGSMFVDALNPNKKFIIKNDGKLYDADNQNIILTSAVTILKRVK